MNAKPIPYQPSMIRAIQREIEQPGMGKPSPGMGKTQTRRIVKPQAWGYNTDALGQSVIYPRSGPSDFGNPSCPIRCPYGQPGDLLWVREAWRAGALNDPDPPRDITPGAPIHYDADGKPESNQGFGRYRHARFMCRWISRYTLLLTDVRVQRVQEITGREAMQEGALVWAAEYDHGYEHEDSAGAWIAFRILWEWLHGPDAWDRNDWVWAMTFRPIAANVDAVLADPTAYISI